MDIPWPGGVPGGATPVPLQGGTNGVLNKPIDVGKAFGGLRSDGYVFIGADPDSQDLFDVEDEDGQREYTKVKLFREDIEEFL